MPMSNIAFKAQQQQTQTQIAGSSSTKRKFEDESNQYVQVKKKHFYGDESRQKDQLLQHMVPVTTHASMHYTPSPNAVGDFANHNTRTSLTTFGMITPPAERQHQLQPQEEHDISMMDEEYTDEDETLQTPSYMNGYSSYMITDAEEDSDSGYIGQLEGGWSEMFSEMDYPYYI
ncbi:hypothetical protein [Parasitella parasitica]|uniref:Uncharacterized protein n=1 Tax=Parasitella parasitica TaxID=35722 RepID=A0A0B7N1U0_9FUNG|nr:hypothetical protein [Parasitella parasitica]